MQTIVDDVGIEGMQDIFEALRERTSAYRQEGRTLPDRSLGGWRRMLDLVEEVGGSAPMTDLWRAWIIPASQENLLLARDEARLVLDGLATAGGAWAPPIGVLDALARWDFPSARAQMAVADGVLGDRDAFDEIESTLGATSPGDLEARYEAIRAEEDATALEDEMAARSAVAAELIATREALALEPSLLARIGLMGELPATGLEAGLAAYASGDMDAASDGAATSMALLDGAEGVGQERVIMAAAITLATIGGLVVLVAVLWRWRRGRRRRRALAAAGASTTLAATPVLDSSAPTLETLPAAIPTEPPRSDLPPPEPAPGADAD
jgi:hypothetical protein